MEKSRKRSVVWEFFKATDSLSVQCQICRTYRLKRVRGSTTNMLKHLRTKHPEVVSQSIESIADGDYQEVDPETEDFCSVEVSLDDADSDAAHSLNELASNGMLQSSQEGSSETIQHVLVTNYRQPGRMRHKRSLIWNYFERLVDSDAVRCYVCAKKLQFSENSGTSNLRRHVLKRHPKAFSDLSAGIQHPLPLNSPLDSNISMDAEESLDATEQLQPPVEVCLDDGNFDAAHSLNEMSSNGTQQTSQEPPEPIQQVVVTNYNSASPLRQQSSLIWKYFERLASLSAARCRICKKKLQCCKNSGTSNLRRHMLKRHPKLFSELKANINGQVFNTSVDGEGRSGTREHPDQLKLSGASRVLRTERELIEALRRTQKEEARTLEHQRELLDKLRAADAREAAAEKEKIELLRKTQQEEAEDLRRQREELEKEKEELLRKWEEFRQEKEAILLFSEGQQTT